MDEHRAEIWKDFRTGIEQAQAAARYIAPIMPAAYKELRNQGLDEVEAAFAAATRMRTYEIPELGIPYENGTEE